MSRAILLACALVLTATEAAAQTEVLPPPPPPMVLPPPPPVLVAPAPQPERRTGFSVKVGLAGTYRNLYGIHFGGGDLSLSLGGQTRGAAFYADLGAFLGRTAFGLSTTDYQLGFSMEGRVGNRFRLGGGAILSVLSIQRVTESYTISTLTLGPQLHGSFDLVRWDDSALFVGLKGRLQWFGSSSLMGAASLGLGFRY